MEDNTENENSTCTTQVKTFSEYKVSKNKVDYQPSSMLHTEMEDLVIGKTQHNQQSSLTINDSGFHSISSLSSSATNNNQTTLTSGQNDSAINLSSKRPKSGFLIRDILDVESEHDDDDPDEVMKSGQGDEALDIFSHLYREYLINSTTYNNNKFPTDETNSQTSIMSDLEQQADSITTSLCSQKKDEIVRMLCNDDPRLVYVNDGMAIRNPFSIDRRLQVELLASQYCERLEMGYLCRACWRTTETLRQMNQHLLSHSEDKFYLCVTCLKGFNDKYDMKRHTRKHTSVKPFKCSVCAKGFSQRCSLEGHERKIHKIELNYARNERRKSIKVCEKCGFTAETLHILNLHHTMEH